MDHDDDRRRSFARVSIAILVCGASLIAGYVLKACPSAIEDTRLGFACHTDITALYGARGIDEHRFPYVDGRLVGDLVDGRLSGYDLELVGSANEYPVLTGVFMWVMGLPVHDAGQYLMVSAVVLSISALATAALLAVLVGSRSLLWSASPLLVLLAFHNWDLLAVGVMTIGVAARWRGRATLAAVCFGLGGALKFYPLLLLVPLVLERWHHGDRRVAVRDGAVGVGAFVAPNVPILILDLEGWLVTYRFHALRPPNYDSLWGVGPLYDLGPAAINVLSTALLIATVMVVLLIAGRRADRASAYPFVPVSAALIAAFLLWSKVHSPQYALWILPFFALVRSPPVWWIAYTIDAVILYVGVFVLGTFSLQALEIVVPGVVYARALLLVALIVAFLRGSDASDPSGDPGARRRRKGRVPATVDGSMAEPST